MSEISVDSSTLTPEYFQHRQAEAAQFSYQNTRYHQLEQDPTFEGADVADFRLLGEDSLYQEQVHTRARLLDHDNSPYEVLPPVYEAKAAELQAAQDKLDTITDQEDARKTRLLAAAKRVVELVPNTERAANKLAHEKISAIENLDRAGLRERVGQLSLELSQLEEALRISGEAWPVPEIIRDYDLAMNQADDDSAEVVIEDEIPLEPETHDVTEQTPMNGKEYHGQTYHASVLLAAYLAEHPDIVFMPQQLGAYLYTDGSHFANMDEATRDRCISQRIHRLLNQHELVKPMLEEQGYRLQYGYRHYIDSKTGQAVQRKRRIYRTISLHEYPDAPATFEETVDPNLQPDIDLPPVFHGQPSKPRQLAAESVSTKEAELTDYANDLIEQLWALELLPEQADGHISIRSLQLKILGLKRCDQHLAPIKILASKLKGALGEYKAEAFEIAVWSLDKQHVPHTHRAKDHRKLATHIASLVETFYETLAT